MENKHNNGQIFSDNGYTYKIPEKLLLNDKKKSIEELSKINTKYPKSVWNFVIKNFSYVIHIINKKFNMITDDMVSDGVYGFYRSLTKYNKKFKYNEFLSYAEKYIYNEVMEGIEKRSTTLSPSHGYIREKTKCVSLDKKINYYEENNLHDLIEDVTQLSPLEITALNDYKTLCKNLFIFFKKHPNYKRNIKIFNEYAKELIIKKKDCVSIETIVAKNLGCSRQNINRVIRRFKQNVLSDLKKYDFKLYKEVKLYLKFHKNKKTFLKMY